MERDHEVIVEVEDTDRVAETNGRAVGELEASVTTLDLDPGRRSHLRRWPRVAHAGLFVVLAFRMGASGFIESARHWSEMHLSKRKSISAIWTLDGAAETILLRSSPVHVFVHPFRSCSWMCKSRS